MTKWLDCFFKILAFLQENLTIIIIFSQSRFKTMPNTKSTLQKLPKPFKILPNIKSTLQKLPKTLKILPQWRKFAKSGHIDFYFKSNIKYVPFHHVGRWNGIKVFSKLCLGLPNSFWNGMTQPSSINILTRYFIQVKGLNPTKSEPGGGAVQLCYPPIQPTYTERHRRTDTQMDTRILIPYG